MENVNVVITVFNITAKHTNEMLYFLP